jgi:hypothetical protein
MYRVNQARQRLQYAPPPVRVRRVTTTEPTRFVLPPLRLCSPVRYSDGSTTPLWARENGDINLYLHAGQRLSWQSDKRIVAILAGTQGGKTSFTPWWLYREIQQRGPGDYIAGTASYDLFKLKFLPALREVFEHITDWGRYWSGDRVIELRNPVTGQFVAQRADDPMWGRIILRSAESGSGMESLTAKGAVLDEAGMDSFTIDTYQAIRRRTALAQARLLLATTLYNLGWLKSEIYDKFQKKDPHIDVVHFDSADNPAFPEEEDRWARENLPDWKYNMQYRGRYDKPAGLVYDCFDSEKHTCPRFAIPDDWQRYLGIDFGGVNTAGVFFAEEPTTKKLYLYRTYRGGNKDAEDHAADLLTGEVMVPITCGGAKSEGQWRRQFRRGGLPVKEPVISDVEVGINRVYGTHSRGEIIVFDDLTDYLHEKGTYSRKLDTQGEPTEEIKDKNTFHLMDAERYIVARIRK